ncbi:MAG: hypothetical protein IJD39_01630 [Clostridia bacterium]|nr:hypothetical protein [Clostridia bacterium]
MMNRKVILILSLVLALAMSLSGTIAYLSDTDSAVNVMTLGNVKIKQHEKDAQGNAFEQGQPLYPAYVDAAGTVTGAIDKVVTVENVGASEAYVRTWIAFEAGTMDDARFAQVIHTDIAADGLTLSNGKFITIAGVKYYVVCATYDQPLAPGATSAPSLKQVYMDRLAGNDDVAHFGETYEILVYTQAVQTANMEQLTATQALDAAFGDEHPWQDGVAGLPTTVVRTADELKEALKDGGIIVVTDDVTVTETLQINKGVTAELILSDADLSYAVSNSGASAIIDNRGNLTISGNGTISFVAANPDMSSIPSYATNTITNEATLTIEEGITVTNGSDGGASYAVDNKGVFYLNGGTLKGERCALRIAKFNQDNVVFVMNGGLVEAATPAWIHLPGSSASAAPTITVTINDGTFQTTKASSADNDVLYTYSFGNSFANTSVTINGGNFLGGTVSFGSGYHGDTETVAINGGNFEYPVKRWVSDSESQELHGSNVAIVSNADELAAAVANGATNIMLADGEYNVKNCGGKTLTLSGSRNAVIKIMNEGEDGCDYGFDGSTVTFNGVTINTTANTGNYKGFARLSATFNDCAFFGAYTTHRVQTFNNCELDFNNGYLWIWGATEVNFNNCTFGGNSKAILAHGSASTEINIKDCAFTATEKGYTGAGDNTAVVEIDPTGTNTYTINFIGNNTKTDSYYGWTRVKDSSTGHIVTGLN